MYHVFPGFGLPPQRAFDALDEVVAQQDVSQVPVLVEVIRFMPSARARGPWRTTLQRLTGQQLAATTSGSGPSGSPGTDRSSRPREVPRVEELHALPDRPALRPVSVRRRGDLAHQPRHWRRAHLAGVVNALPYWNRVFRSHQAIAARLLARVYIKRLTLGSTSFHC